MSEQRYNRTEYDNKLKSFLNDNSKQVLMVRCYEHDDSVFETIKTLSQSPKIQKALVKVNRMDTIPEVLKVLYKYGLPKKITHDTEVQFKGLKLMFNSRDYLEPSYQDADCFVYIVGNVLYNGNRLKRLRTVIEKTTKKIIIITSNDWSNHPRELYDLVDDVCLLDTNSEEKNIKEMNTLKINLRDRGENLPY